MAKRERERERERGERGVKEEKARRQGQESKRGKKD